MITIKYSGHVYDYYDRKITLKKEYITTAPSKTKAKSNITFRIKKDLAMDPFHSRIFLDEKRIEEIK